MFLTEELSGEAHAV